MKGSGIKTETDERDSSCFLASLGRSPWLFSSLVAYPEVPHAVLVGAPRSGGAWRGWGAGWAWLLLTSYTSALFKAALGTSGLNGSSLGHMGEGDRAICAGSGVWWATSVLASWERPSERHHAPNSRQVAHPSLDTRFWKPEESERLVRVSTVGAPAARSVPCRPHSASRNWSCSGGFLTHVPRPAFWNALHSCCLTAW